MAALIARFRSDPRMRWGVLGAGALAGFALLLTTAFGSSDDSLAAMTLQTLARTALVLGLLFLSLAALKRWQTGSARVKQLAVMETLRLSPRQAVHLMRVGERLLLIGASDAQISLLADVSEMLMPDSTAAPNVFARFLEPSQKQ